MMATAILERKFAKPACAQLLHRLSNCNSAGCNTSTGSVWVAAKPCVAMAFSTTAS